MPGVAVGGLGTFGTLYLVECISHASAHQSRRCLMWDNGGFCSFCFCCCFVVIFVVVVVVFVVVVIEILVMEVFFWF